jgi:uroporphyrin-III C-methyltransferase
VTHRSYASSVAIATGHKTAGDEVKWGELARAVDTLVILMGMHNLAVIIARLQASGCEPEKPVALIQSGTLSDQTCLFGTIATITDIAGGWKAMGPVVIIIGQVAKMGQELQSLTKALIEHGSVSANVTDNSAELSKSLTIGLIRN